MGVEHKLKVLYCVNVSEELADGLAREPFEEAGPNVC